MPTLHVLLVDALGAQEITHFSVSLAKIYTDIYENMDVPYEIRYVTKED